MNRIEEIRKRVRDGGYARVQKRLSRISVHDIPRLKDVAAIDDAACVLREATDDITFLLGQNEKLREALALIASERWPSEHECNVTPLEGGGLRHTTTLPCVQVAKSALAAKEEKSTNG